MHEERRSEFDVQFRVPAQLLEDYSGVPETYSSYRDAEC